MNKKKIKNGTALSQSIEKKNVAKHAEGVDKKWSTTVLWQLNYVQHHVFGFNDLITSWFSRP